MARRTPSSPYKAYIFSGSPLSLRKIWAASMLIVFGGTSFFSCQSYLCQLKALTLDLSVQLGNLFLLRANFCSEFFGTSGPKEAYQAYR